MAEEIHSGFSQNYSGSSDWLGGHWCHPRCAVLLWEERKRCPLGFPELRPVTVSPTLLPRRRGPYLKVPLPAGQVERHSLACVSGTRVGTVLQQEGDEVRPAMQGSHMQGRGAVLVGHIHTKPTGRNPCQFLVKAEGGNKRTLILQRLGQRWQWKSPPCSLTVPRQILGSQRDLDST